MNLSRRELLALMAMASATSISGCSSLTSPPKRQILLSGVYDASKKEDPRIALAVHNIDGSQLQLIPTEVAAHSIIQDPQNSTQFVLFPQAGKRAAVLNLTNGKNELRYFRATPDHMFYGHGAYTPDGSAVYSVETQEFRGKIVLRELKNLSVVKEWPLPGFGAHDCQLSRDGQHLFVAMDGIYAPAKNQFAIAESSLLELNVQTGTIRRRSNSPQGLALGHFAMTASGVVAGAMTIKGDNHSSLALAPSNADFRELSADNEKPDHEEQTLSVAIHEGSQIVAGVCPRTNKARFWSAQSGAFLGQLTLNHPVGVSAISEGFAITSRDGITRVNSKTLTPVTNSVNLEGLSYLAHHSTFFI